MRVIKTDDDIIMLRCDWLVAGCVVWRRSWHRTSTHS